MKTLIVDRRKWLRGEGTYSSYLLREEDKKMCCLGFDCIRRGFKTCDIIDAAVPDGLIDEYTMTAKRFEKRLGLLKGLVNAYGFRTKTCRTMMAVNDDTKIGDDVRERKLTYLFARIGIKVKFIN